jgi:hypothetical protein
MQIKINRFVYRLIILILLAVTVASYVYYQARSKQKITYLFVLASDAGHMKRISRTVSVLSIPLQQKNQVLAFTDRPVRRQHYISAKDFAKSWAVGRNSFLTDPPNVVVSAQHIAPIIAIMSDFKIEKHMIFMKLKTEQGLLGGGYKNITITIDGSNSLKDGSSCRDQYGAEGTIVDGWQCVV